MKNKYIINWELSLICNLDCYFCSQKNRRKEQKQQLSFNEVKNIINNLPKEVHISFLGGETLLFPNIIDIFYLLEIQGITYEITTNGILLEEHYNSIISLRNLTQINISLDGFDEYHDLSRGKIGIFSKISSVLPKLVPYKKISISTVITNISYENLAKLSVFLERLGITEHKLIYLMNFSEQDIQDSKKAIRTIKISSPGSTKINKNYKNEFLKKYIFLKKIQKKMSVTFEPETILKKGDIGCKQLDKQYRINENGNLSICEFIDNEFGSLIHNKFEDIIHDKCYKIFTEEILSKFPLEICKTCCKQYNVQKYARLPPRHNDGSDKGM